jgi:hypothetical protein
MMRKAVSVRGQAILLPDYPAMSYPGLALSFIAEVGLGLWLLFKGIKDTADAPGLPD